MLKRRKILKMAEKFKKKKKFDDETGEEKKSNDSKKLDIKGRKMLLQMRGDIFRCVHCRNEVSLHSVSTKHRNHCPYCLYSLHVDKSPGDRKSECHGSMRPLAVCLKQHGKELALVHQCQSCGFIRLNRIAAEDDNEAIEKLFETSQRLSPEQLDAIAKDGIAILIEKDRALLTTILYGNKSA
jgi:DNA-directed RNA polymerase subunit RPC12/RpoP